MDKYIFVYKGENAPQSKEVIWIHHEEFMNPKSKFVVEMWIKGSWRPLIDASGGGISDEQYQAIINRLLVLENNSTNYVLKSELGDYATKGYVDDAVAGLTPGGSYDDSELVAAIAAIQGDITEILADIVELQNRPDNDHIYDDTELRGLITALGSRVTSLEGRVTALENSSGGGGGIDAEGLWVKLTQAQYDALATKSDKVLYIIVD